MECDVLGTSLCDSDDRSTLESSGKNETFDDLGTSFDHAVEDTLQPEISLILESDALGISLCDSEDRSTLESSGENVTFDSLGTSFEHAEEGGLNETPVATSTPYKLEEFDRVCAKRKKEKPLAAYLTSEIGSSHSTLQDKVLSRAAIYSILDKNCLCANNCLSKVDFSHVRQLRLRYWKGSTRSSRTVMLNNYLEKSFKMGRKTMMVLNDNVQVCSKAFQSIMHINKNTVSRAYRSFKQTIRQRAMKGNTLTAINWFEDYTSFMGDRMPNSSDVLLPLKMQMSSIYLQYKSDVSGLPVSLSQFFKIWKTYFPHVKIKQTNSFSKCSTCTTLEKKWENTADLRVKVQYRKLKEEHYQRQQMERRYYYSKRDKSRNQPDKYMSMIVDGMDQSKTNLPHFAGRRSKSINAADLLKTHVTGVINHGHGGFHTYIDINEYQHDPNLTINVLIKTIHRTVMHMGHKLPPCLFIQADNCWRENKNKCVLAFLEHLVAENIFSEVHISFLMVGHTHEDVDAAFSKVSCKLRKTDAETLEELLELIPNSELIGTMFDVKSWLEPCLVSITHLTQPLHYRFMKRDEYVQVTYKGKFDDVWINLNGNFLKSDTPLLDYPALLQPDYGKIDFPRFIKLLENVAVFFKDNSVLQKWKNFCAKAENVEEIHPTDSEWPLLRFPRQDALDVSLSGIISDGVQTLINKETRVPEVVVPKRKRRQ